MLTAQDRRDRYARRRGISPDPEAWAGRPAEYEDHDDGTRTRTAHAIYPAGTGLQRRRIGHKERHAHLTEQGTARRSRIAVVAARLAAARAARRWWI